MLQTSSFCKLSLFLGRFNILPKILLFWLSGEVVIYIPAASLPSANSTSVPSSISQHELSNSHQFVAVFELFLSELYCLHSGIFSSPLANKDCLLFIFLTSVQFSWYFLLQFWASQHLFLFLFSFSAFNFFIGCTILSYKLFTLLLF